MDPIKFNAAMPLAGRYEAAGHAVYPNSLIFEAGHYPDKSYSMSPAEIAAAVAAFAPLKGNIEHTDFLKGSACEVRRLFVDPADPGRLRGEVAVPLALDSVLGDRERRLSAEWHPTSKTLLGLALTTSPRIEEAALMTAFRAAQVTPHGAAILQQIHDTAAAHGAVCTKMGAKAPRRFVAAHERAALQKVHDMTTAHGASCPSMSSPHYSKDTPMSLKDKLDAWFKAMPDDLDDDGTTEFAEVKDDAPAPKPKPAPKPVDVAPADFSKHPQFAAMQAELAQIKRKSAEDAAVAFVGGVVSQKKIADPRFAENAARLFIALAGAAPEAKVTFSGTGADGKALDAEVGVLDAFKGLLSSLPAHPMYFEHVSPQQLPEGLAGFSFLKPQHADDPWEGEEAETKKWAAARNGSAK